MTALTPMELAVLAAVHRADEEEGGLSFDDLDTDERDALISLAGKNLVETRADDDGAAWARITWRGIEALRDAGVSR